MNYAEAKAYLGGDTIKCLICGKQFTSLGKHLFRAHGVTADDYKTEYGIPYKWSLSTPEVVARKKASFPEDQRERVRELGKLVGGLPHDRLPPARFGSVARDMDSQRAIKRNTGPNPPRFRLGRKLKP